MGTPIWERMGNFGGGEKFWKPILWIHSGIWCRRDLGAIHKGLIADVASLPEL